MRILYVSIAYPLPANNGSKMRLWAVMRAIANAGHKVSLAAFCEPEEIDGTEPELRAVCEESEVIPLHYARLSEGGDYLRRLRAIVSPSPFTIDRFRSDDMRLRLQRKANNRSFDVVICDNVYSAINLAAGVSPIVMNSQNVEYLILQRYAEQEKNPFKAMYARLEAAKVRRFEAAMYRRAVCAMTCSTVDAGLVRQLCPGIQVFIAPNVVDVRDYGLESEEEPFTIVYQGGMDWYPNRDALEYFVRQVLPLVQKQVPRVRLIAAGRNPAPGFKARFSDVTALEFTGTLADLRPVIAKAAVAVVPLRIGSGTRLKILEAGAMRKAIVSTSVGVEGLDFKAGKEILIADDQVTFARDVVELLHDPARRKALGEAARNRVLRDYDRTVLERSVASALASLERTISIEARKKQLASVG